MHIRTALVVVVLVLGAAAGPAATVAQSSDVTVTVTVRTAAGGAVANADLTVSWDGGTVTETTRSNGQALVDVPEGADVTIEVDHPFYVRNSPYELSDASSEEVEVTVWEKANATVTVVDGSGPVEDALVIFQRGGTNVITETTDSDGTVESGVIESGEYRISVRKPGYYRQSEQLDIQGDTTEEIPIERGSVTVEFHVLDDNFDPLEPIPDATIQGSDFSTSTQPDGSRSVSIPVNTQLSVTVEKDGYETVERRLVVSEESRTVDITTRREDDVQVSISNERVVVGETVEVIVTDEYGESLPLASVYLDGEAVGQPDATGELHVPIESSGEHTLFAQLDQLSSEQLTVTGIESGSGSVETRVAGVPLEGTDDDGASGFLTLPALGPLHLRSGAIGIAGGLVLAAGLFVYFRVG